ncbi:hypothetical protein MYAER_4231 [Microcystis aeruginosa NIES-2549]|uniref:Uncharacterized protein n=1 Tax=Microcystis aeruginosa NIES-2549 TaxID=1641812 RepID=A0A0F6RNX1_MICAE|nr:hypothetical protein MYAER_4231 [Microcystis aeruginosa NIES-2549]AOC54956.1 hypothetical protein amyaer_4277 [Microcystis aeruginosa NIES-2481]
MPTSGMVSLGLIILYLPLPSHQHLYSLHIWDAPIPIFTG